MPSADLTILTDCTPRPEVHSRQASYAEFPPGPDLAASVECFWISTLERAPHSSSVHRVVPDGCMDLLFDFTRACSGQASVIGTMTRPLAVTATGAVDLLGVRFRPGGLPRFVKLDAAELTDGQAELSNFWGDVAGETWHRLSEAGPATRLSLLRGMLGARANGGVRPDAIVQHCVRRIEVARGSLRIRDLERSTGLSSRQLERKFSRHVGVSPKTLARVVRFKAATTAAAAHPGPPEWSALAGEFGFADQSHLAREFRSLSGLTPAAFLVTTRHASPDVGFLQDSPAARG